MKFLKATLVLSIMTSVCPVFAMLRPGLLGAANIARSVKRASVLRAQVIGRRVPMSNPSIVPVCLPVSQAPHIQAATQEIRAVAVVVEQQENFIKRMRDARDEECVAAYNALQINARKLDEAFGVMLRRETGITTRDDVRSTGALHGQLIDLGSCINKMSDAIEFELRLRLDAKAALDRAKEIVRLKSHITQLDYDIQHQLFSRKEEEARDDQWEEDLIFKYQLMSTLSWRLRSIDPSGSNESKDQGKEKDDQEEQK